MEKKNCLKGAAVRVFLIMLLAFMMPVSMNVLAEETGTSTEDENDGSSSSKVRHGWHSVRKSGKYYYYYITADGKRLKNCWLKIGSKYYYLSKKKGYRLTGLRKINKKRYYFNSNGVRRTGWRTISGKRYYFRPKYGYALTGKQTVKGQRYLFSAKGVMLMGWQEYDGKTYYLAGDGHMLTGLQTIDGETYYFSIKTGARIRKLVKVGDAIYYFQSDGRMLKNGFTPGGRYCYKDGKVLKKSTLKRLLQTAMQPVGQTLYVWGGGWGTDDVSSGIDAVTIGVAPRWKEFFNMYGSSYDYTTTRYQTRDGLDCSGYVGWVLYNTFNTTSGNAGFVMLAENMAYTYSSYGWGSYSSAGSFNDFRAGDIMSLAAGHVYIVVGQCSDGSVVLLHSSPPGVMLTGTYSSSGSKLSVAAGLADKYMKKYFPEYYERYSEKLIRDTSYLTGYSRMRWYLSGKCLMSDPDGFADKNASQVLKNLLGSV